jgi:hypothetical protein
MSDSTTRLDTISASQASKEVTANDLFDAMSPPTLYGRRASTTAGLEWGFYGGPVIAASGGYATIVNSTVTLTGSLVNYLEAKRDGTMTRVSSQFTPGRYACYKVYTSSGAVNSYEDFRTIAPVLSQATQRSVNSMGDASITLNHAQASARIIEMVGTLTSSQNVVMPDGPQEWVVCNTTSGGFNVNFKTAAGSAVAIAATKRAIVYADGVNMCRVTPDT